MYNMYNSIVRDHLCDTRLPTFETLSFFTYGQTLRTILLAHTQGRYRKLASSMRDMYSNQRITDTVAWSTAQVQCETHI